MKKTIYGRIAASLLTTVVLATGCTVGPNYKRPDALMPDRWSEAGEDETTAKSPDLTQWWTNFNDPILNSLIARAVSTNLDLRQAQARIREARAARAVTAAGEWPAVDVSGS